ncbi:hypothetical protein [Streptomyces sp. NBC_01477]|uniref:hypothetical protein n=1 Tax=Streptomyces sp. NBC_01477 TaxID=2976015 RepID=UPI002E36408F|nr:hypothetical protein [Streptomyces sp. NBC_01477]
MGSPNSDIGVTPGPVSAAAVQFKMDRAAGADKAALSKADTAATAHSGWASSAATTACVTAWRTRMHEMGNDVEAAADGVTHSMDVYMNSDISVSSRLHQQATWLEES